MNKKGDTNMDNSQTFIRGQHAPDGIHEIVEFNEYRNAKWWSEQRHREWLMERLMPFAIVAGAVAAFCIVGIIEKAL